MVRLEGIKLMVIDATIVKFQFQNGTIKSTGGSYSFASWIRHFNSKMVRLKVQQQIQRVKAVQSYFNSKMVRLKVFANSKRYINDVISIPKWYD